MAEADRREGKGEIWVGMEGVGARLGRSSTRYGPATVFTGPVRKWKKKWVHVSPSAASSNSNNNATTHNNNNHASSNGNNGSHLLLYKWTPITQSQNNANTNNSNGNAANAKDAAPEPPEEPPRRKFKYIPVFYIAMHSFYFFSILLFREFSLGFWLMDEFIGFTDLVLGNGNGGSQFTDWIFVFLTRVSQFGTKIREGKKWLKTVLYIHITKCHHMKLPNLHYCLGYQLV